MHWNETLSQKVTACEWGNLRIKVHGCIRIFGTFSFSQTEKSNYKTQKPEWIILAWHLQKVKQQISKIHLDVWSNDSFWCQCDYKLWRFEHNLILRLEMFQRLSIWTLKRKGVTQLLLGIEDRWRERERANERTIETYFLLSTIKVILTMAKVSLNISICTRDPTIAGDRTWLGRWEWSIKRCQNRHKIWTKL